MTLAVRPVTELTDAELEAEALALLAHDDAHGRTAPGEKWPTPGALARVFNPRSRQTPALAAIDRALVDLLNTPDGRLIITLPPQEGKSTRVAGDFPAWCLIKNPDMRIVVASYGQSLAVRNGRSIRTRITQNPQLGLSIARDNGSVHEWTLAGHLGGVLSVGIGTGLTGRAADLICIDDPIKDRAEAESERFRQRVWDWWTDVASTRLAPGAPTVLIQCMTGDTPVLMGDGREKPLREVRPGDSVATYDDGAITTSIVRNWANQGPDQVYRVRMKSGVEVRANERHPFLVVERGRESWRRLRDLKVGDAIVRAMRPEEASAGCPVRLPDATSPPSARACACPTTPRLGGPLAIAPPPRATPPGVPFDSKGATASRPRSTTAASRSRAAGVPSAGASPARSLDPSTGPRCSASTTTMTPDVSAVCCATTATSSSREGTLPRSSTGPLSTCAVTSDQILGITVDGVEDVFDIQVERTENFIANGLAVHNTRWHEDDLAGRLIAGADGEQWQVLNIPALADHRPERGEVDPLGRAPGEFLLSARGRTDAQWEAIRTRSATTWTALYQGRPAPPEGLLFQRGAWARYSTPLAVPRGDGSMWVPPAPGDVIAQSWDMAFKATSGSDYVVGGVWLKRGHDLYLLDMVRARLTFTETVQAVRDLSAKWPQAITKLVEDKANGTAVMDSLRNEVVGLTPVEPEGGKVARANAAAPLVVARNVHLPDPELLPIVTELIEEAASFPAGKHDDAVDMLTQAVLALVINPLIGEAKVASPTGLRIGGAGGGRRLGGFGR